MTLRCWPPLCFPKARVGIVSLRLTSSSAILEPGGGKGPLWGLCLDFRALFLVSRVFAKFVSYTIWDLLLFATFPLQVFEFFFRRRTCRCGIVWTSYYVPCWPA